MDTLTSIEICELGQIKVKAVQDKSIFVVGRECISLANFLKVSVQLYFNDKVIDVYTNTTIEQILSKI